MELLFLGPPVLLTFLVGIIYLTFIIGAIVMIYKWVTRIISLKQEHNDLLREIIKKMDSK